MKKILEISPNVSFLKWVSRVALTNFKETAHFKNEFPEGRNLKIFL